MLKIGTRGFTLIEVMVATCILALGTVLIYEAFFISWDAFNYALNYLNVANWIDEKIQAAEVILSREGSLNIPTEGEFRVGQHTFFWHIESIPIDEIKDTAKLFKIEFSLNQKKTKRGLSISRQAYAICFYK